MGSTVVLYPVGIWFLWTVLYRIWPVFSIGELAWFFWFLGMGGLSVYALAQWLAPLLWRRTIWLWVGLSPFAALAAARIEPLLTDAFKETALARYPFHALAIWVPYYVMMGVVLAYQLPDTPAPVHKTRQPVSG